MPSHPPSAQDLAGRIIDAETGTTALHQAAQKGTLQNLCGVTAALLATVKDNYGWTPLHHAANCGHLDQIGDLTIKLAKELRLLSATLQPQNSFVFTEDFRRHGAHYNHCPTIRTALIEAANQLPDLQLPNAPPSKPPSAPHKRAASCYLPNSSPSYYRSRPQGTRTGAASQSAAPAQ